MIDRVIAFSVRRRGWVLLGAAVWAVAGVSALMHTPMDAVPDLSENQVIVYATWPGHSPAEIEDQVSYPLTTALQGLPDLRTIRASSDIGQSTLYLIFEDRVSFRSARNLVLEKMPAVTGGLPAGVTPELAPEGIPTGQIFWYTVEGSGDDLAELRALQQWTIAPQLEAVPGVAEVASVGGFNREVQIKVDELRLLERGLTIDGLAQAIAGEQVAVGGHIVTKGNAEFVVEVTDERRASGGSDRFGLKRLEQLSLPGPLGSVLLKDVARISLGASVRRGLLEKDGNEVVGGIVHVRYGHNVLDVIRAVKGRLLELAPGLPAGVRVVPCYDRSPLIIGAVSTTARTLLEAILVACGCIVLVLRHWRTSLVVALSLPLAVLGAVLGMWLLRWTGVADVQTNIMSLAGIVISIGILVDASIVLSENVLHELRRQYGDDVVSGRIDSTVIRACQAVGRPVFYSTLIVLVSFLPVFALSGIDGRMYSPLAWTKSLSIVSAALLAVTLVPALASLLIRGRIQDESTSPIVRAVMQVYRPVLSSLLDRPAPLVWMLSVLFVAAAAVIGQRWLLLSALAAGMVICGLVARSTGGQAAAVVSLVGLAVFGESCLTPMRTELRMPLNEGMVMDMPITVPRASIAESGDDMKARDMVLCRFPEVRMVVGKAGRADTPFDPAPLDMIETMIEFRPQEQWPRRRLSPRDARRHVERLLHLLVSRQLLGAPGDEVRESLVDSAMEDGLLRFDAVLREVAHLRIQAFQRTLSSDLAAALVAQVAADQASQQQPEMSVLAAVEQQLPAPRVRELATEFSVPLVNELYQSAARLLPAAEPPVTLPTVMDSRAAYRRLESLTRQKWAAFGPELDADLARRAPVAWTRIASEELIARCDVLDPALADVMRQAYAARYAAPKPHHHVADESADHMGLPGELPLIDPHPAFDRILAEAAGGLARSLRLEVHDAESLAGFGGEMDRSLQMPGWTNVWTKPIQNRVDMLTTGVNSEVGIRVQGRNLDDVVRASEDIAAVVRQLPGARDVVADPIRGKGYVKISPDAERAAAEGVSLAELNVVIETALSGRVIAQQAHGRERIPVRILLAGEAGDDELTLRRLLIPTHSAFGAKHAVASHSGLSAVSLDSVADVHVTEGPATIKSENGWLRNYVRLNVADRDVVGFVDDARRVVAAQVVLPAGVFVEWTGQYEHSRESRRKLLLLMPLVLGLIVVLLYLTYRDWADAALMALAVPGALAGGVLCQWALGQPFSIAVGMGYIACFGMAAATGIVMLVYLREAVSRRGGLQSISLEQLREATLNGAVHRLRPKLLTEATTIVGLAPILWSHGIGAEVIRPMTTPVLGGLLIADEVIDLLVPILFYHIRRGRWLRMHGGGDEITAGTDRPVWLAATASERH